METIGKKSIVENLCDLDFKYRDTVNSDSSIPFGTELEFITYDKNTVNKINKELKSLKRSYVITDVNRIYNLLNERKIYELKTPRLFNDYDSFKELKIVSDVLNKNKVEPGNNKGMHVHVDLSSLEEDNDYLMTFLKLFSIYEHIIFRFSYGENYSSNINVASYSREISNILYNFLSRTDLSDDFYNNVEELKRLLTCKSYALNFHMKDGTVKNDTIEMRTFNGTINPVIIQNNINLLLSIISSIKYNEIDKDLLNYRFEEYDKGFYVKENYSNINESDALEFSDLVFESNIDKEYFLRQYFYKEKEKTKKLVI